MNEKIQAALEQLLAELRRQIAEQVLQAATEAQQTAQAEAVAQTLRAARSAVVEGLLASVLRLRRAADLSELGTALLETASAHCGRAGLLVIDGETLAGWRATGFSGDRFADAWAALRLPWSQAPAIVEAMQSREPVVTSAAPGHLSPALAELLGASPDQKAWLFPICRRDAAVALLYADAPSPDQVVEPAALQLLVAVAEASIEALSARSDGAVSRVPARTPPPDWDELSPSERDLHLRAQRLARLLVADLQLYRPQEVRQGRRSGDLYARLTDEIERSRDVYQRKFPASPDYFHMELVRTLAGDQESLLGPDYPGPLAA
jgi:hypothetical protein